MPKPFPLFEIFVYSPEMEAIHLRGGMVARGGIRWSDRKEDYRTEVLGLMKAQKVKNAVIVPDGSKGGFILKRSPAAPDELKAEVVHAVRHVHARPPRHHGQPRAGRRSCIPSGVRVLDGDDPYLVVAADKGTATFSDTANAVSEEYGFWLGDAFASGGCAGYDHKALGHHGARRLGIGEAALPRDGHRRHARPLHRVGIGDMSGDVFGNGMLLLRQASSWWPRSTTGNIFIDPDPDPAISFAERKRLFQLPGSSWNDYDRSLLSAGGDVIDRKAK